MGTMPAISSPSARLREWIERGLKANGHPPLADLVSAGRASSLGWRAIADDITTKSGETVSHESIRQWFTEPAEARP